MKKLLFIIIAFIQVTLYGQYQLRNANFEEWEELDPVSDSLYEEPKHWSSMGSNYGKYASLARAIQLRKSSDTHTGEGYSCVIEAREIKIVKTIANGLVTTGRVHAGSTSASNPANHNATLREEADYNAPFTGRPDSISFWAKFECPNSATQLAKMHAVIHGDCNCTDPVTGNTEDYIVGNAVLGFTRAEWKEYVVPFTYDGAHDDPRYMLITFATNQEQGKGAATDKLYVDDVSMIYNPYLENLTVNGDSLPGFSPDVTEYTYSKVICSNPYPDIIATPREGIEDGVSIIMPTQKNPKATIIVDNGRQTKEYTINFTFLPEIAKPLVSNDTNLCDGGEITFSATTEEEELRWYSSLMAKENDTVGNDHTLTITETTIVYAASYDEQSGCESERVPITVIVYFPSNDTIYNLQSCEALVWNDTTYEESGFYTQIFKSVHGCDSLVTVELIVTDTIKIDYAADVCANDNYTGYGFNLSGWTKADTTYTYERIVQNQGCDTLITLSLWVKPVDHIHYQDQIAYWEIYTEHGFDIQPYELGMLYDTLHYTNRFGCDSIVTLELLITTDIQTLEKENQVQLHPNPAKDYVKISAVNQIEQVELYDANGKLIQTMNGVLGNELEYRTSFLSPGFYLLKIKLETGVITKKLIVQ